LIGIKEHAINPGITYALLAAVLFGASTPLAKMLIAHTNPVMLAGLFYLGSGIGLALVMAGRLFLQRTKTQAAYLTQFDLPWFGGAVFFGGVLGPSLLMYGLIHTPGSTAALLLNLEGVFTALLAWFVFRENFDRRIFWGMVSILSGSLLLSWGRAPTSGGLLGILAIAAACFCWAIDNNLTRKVSASDPFQIACVKGLVAGTVNIGLAFLVGFRFPELGTYLPALVIGFLGYGLSLALFVLALRHLGTARTGAYFSSAPFVGATLALVILQEVPSLLFILGFIAMALGLWLHLTERHGHIHTHTPLTHRHSHCHDQHHQHEHDFTWDGGTEPHTHEHFHPAMTHFHEHFPDIHHQHKHKHDNS
jgi:drug/metabolite transporter (DMT)-like permease